MSHADAEGAQPPWLHTDADNPPGEVYAAPVDTDRFPPQSPAAHPGPPAHPHPPMPVAPVPPPGYAAPPQVNPPQMGPPPMSPPPMSPPPGYPPAHTMPPGYAMSPEQGRTAPPTSGWRRAVHTASGGLINLGQSKSQQQLDAMIARIRRPITGQFHLAVLSLKGGVGKTTTTLGLGSAFASLRGDRVIAVDANPDLGTLANRVPQQTVSTVRTLLHDRGIVGYPDVRRHTSQASSRLEVLASERDPAISEAFDADEYRQVVSILDNFYNIIMTDCGTGLVHSAMQGALGSADALVLVTSPAVDGAQSASATLDWLNAHGYAHLAQQAVVVISASKPGSAPIDLDMLTQHFLGRTRAVQIIPFDDHLATGSHVELDNMHRRTRTAFLELAATVADSFAPAPPVHAAPHPGAMHYPGPPQQPGPPPGPPMPWPPNA